MQSLEPEQGMGGWGDGVMRDNIYLAYKFPLRDVGDVKSRGCCKLKRDTQVTPQSQLMLEETRSIGCCITQRK